jgi:hypothetical protein
MDWPLACACAFPAKGGRQHKLVARSTVCSRTLCVGSGERGWLRVIGLEAIAGTSVVDLEPVLRMVGQFMTRRSWSATRRRSVGRVPDPRAWTARDAVMPGAQLVELRIPRHVIFPVPCSNGRESSSRTRQLDAIRIQFPEQSESPLLGRRVQSWRELCTAAARQFASVPWEHSGNHRAALRDYHSCVERTGVAPCAHGGTRRRRDPVRADSFDRAGHARSHAG